MNLRIQAIIQNFVSELTAALTEASHAALTQALGGNEITVGPQVRQRRISKASNGSGTAKSGASLSTLPDGRKRRNADDVQRQLAAVLAFVKKNPASGAEAIGSAVGLSTTELAAPIRLGLSSKVLKKSGKLRGTKYSLK